MKPTCSKCDAQSPLTKNGVCRAPARCRIRRYEKRAREERRNGAPQCMATEVTSASRRGMSIKFCVRGRGHAGLHFTGSHTFVDESADPVAQDMKAALGGTP